eukprot:6194520-Amphidinium_carterae.1
MFSSAWKKVVVVRLQSIVTEAVDELRKMKGTVGKGRKAAFEALKQKHLTRMNGIPEQEVLPERRKVTVAYRHITVEMVSRCNSEHLDHALQAGLKEMAARSGALVLLPCEDIGAAERIKLKIDASLLSSHTEARQDLLRYLSYESEETERGADLLLVHGEKLH